ncbi:MAG: hypothetical protein RIG62_24490 [Cyclobacteriaceae bacterium]|jgi:hypothetical protein
MKRLFYFLTLLFIVCSFIAQATVIRVNNRESSVPEENTYDNLAEAYNKAESNDTLHIEGSPDEYGGLTLTKPLTVIGPGYFLTENDQLQTVEQVASTREFSFEPGSEGSIIAGITFNQNTPYSRISISTNDIKISGCYFKYPVLFGRGTFENIIISQCFFPSTAIAINHVVYTRPFINFYFANNIVRGNFSIPDGSSGTIINNVFVGDVFNVGTTSSLQIHNNVLLSTDDEKIVVPSLGSNISYNIASLKTFGTDNGNQADILASQVFLQQGSTDGQWKIKVDGVAAGAGRDGYDVGAFGGPDPYRLSGVPSIPRITDLSTDGYVTEEGELLIEIQVTAN